MSGVAALESAVRLDLDYASVLGRRLGASDPRPPVAILIGVLAALSSILLRYLVSSFIGDGEALLTAFPLLLSASLVGGGWSGWTCLVLCTVASWYLFIGEAFSFSLGPHEGGILVGTFLAGAFVIGISILLRRAFREIVELRATEALLSRELQHRIQNTLTLVLSIARQIFRSGHAPEVAFADFEARIVALAAAQDLAPQRRSAPTPVRTIVERSLLPFCGGLAHERLRLSTASVEVEHDTTIALFLVLHELATNAAKYGALSVARGIVAIDWSRDADGRIVLEWREQGGPPVVAPTRQGFGTKLIERVVTRSLGSIDVSYAPDGVVARIAVRPDAGSGGLRTPRRR